MMAPMRMEEDRSHMTKKILNLTLEIIYLLTGKRFPLVKSGNHMTITVPPCYSLKPERHNMEKILEVTKKMMELLTGESGKLRDCKVVVKEEIKEEDGVMKNSEFLKGHKDLYQDTMVESSSYRDPPERCPRPLYSRDSTQEGHTIPPYLKSGDPIDIEFEVKPEEEERYVRDDQQSMEEDEIKEKDDEDGVMEEEHKDLSQDTMVESSSYINPPERCPRPLYSRDSTQEGHTIPHHQSGNLGDDNIVVKEEYKEEDEEYGVMVEISEGHKDMMEPPNTRNPPERCPRPPYEWDSTQESHTIPHHHQESPKFAEIEQSILQDGISITANSEDTIESVHIEPSDDEEESYSSSIQSEIDEESQNFDDQELFHLQDGRSISSCSEDTIPSFHVEESDEESDVSSVKSEIDEDVINLRKRLENKYRQPGEEEPPAFPVNPLKSHRPQENLEEEPAEHLLGHTIWCHCDNCRPMPTNNESKCCQNLEEVKPFLEGLSCVTDNKEFIERCLTKRILMYQLSVQSESSKKEYIRDANRCLRKGAYRCYTNMIHGFLGRNKQIPIPSCVVWSVRSTYPDAKEEYTGFKWSSDYNASDMAFE